MAGKWKKIIAREYGVQYTELSLRSLSSQSGFIIPEPFYSQIYIPEDGNEACYMGEGEWGNFVLSLKKKYLEKPKNYYNFEKAFLKAGKDYVETAKKISKINLRAKSDHQLQKLYYDYQKKNLHYAPFIWVQFIVNNFFADKAAEIIRKKFGKNKKGLIDYIGLALKPYKKAQISRLVELAAIWKRLSAAKKYKVYKKFQWMPCMDIHNNPWTKEEFFAHIKDFKISIKPAALEKITLSGMEFSKDEKSIMKIARRLAYLKDLKDDFRRQGIFYSGTLFKEIGARMELSSSEVSYALQEEIVDFLNKEKMFSKSVAEERKNGFIIYYNSKNKIECKSGKEAEDALNYLGLTIRQEIFEEIKGMVASNGKAKGPAIIIKTISDLKKVKRGDILVAVTTHPDYVSVMRKACAIVTDEGGIASHAAIVSRELNVPCIVGTKIATKILKDGDLAEIDAEKGIVKILKKK